MGQDQARVKIARLVCLLPFEHGSLLLPLKFLPVGLLQLLGWVFSGLEAILVLLRLWEGPSWVAHVLHVLLLRIP